MILILVLDARAGDHELVAPAAVAVSAEGPDPIGPPRQVELAAGQPVQEAVASLPAGSRLILGPGRHAGPVYIRRPLVLTGRPGAVLDGGGTGSVLVIGAPDVAVTDLRLTGGGRQPQRDDAGVVSGADRVRLERLVIEDVYIGIDLRMAHDGVVADCRISGAAGDPFGLRGDGIRLWESDRNQIRNNVLENVRDLVVWYSNDNTIQGNTVRDSRYGTHLMHTTGNTIVDNDFVDNVVGVFVMYSVRTIVSDNVVTGARGEAGVGIGLKDSDELRIERNMIVGDTTGLYIDSIAQRIGSTASFSGNQIAGNEIGIRLHGPSPGARFEGNVWMGNRTAAARDAGHGSEGDVHFDGNFWSDYAGYDLDADGTGDLPFEVRSATGTLLEREPSLAYLTGTPALQLIELFAAAFPLFAPEVWFVDHHPRMAP